MYGVFTADISLAWLTELVNGIRPYPRSYNLMIGREGTYLSIIVRNVSCMRPSFPLPRP